MARSGDRLRSTVGLLLGVGCGLPILYLLLLSLAKQWIVPDLLPDHFSPERWVDLWSGTDSPGVSMALSLLVSAIVAVLATLGGFLASKYLAYHRHRSALLFLAYMPFVMSPVILGTCIHFLYIKIGLSGGIVGVVLAQSIFALGFGVIFFTSFWNEERRAFEEIARLLGGSTLQVYRRVLLPVGREMLMICLLQTFLFSWFQYGLTLLIGAGKVRTLPVLVFMYIGEANIYYAAASSVLLILPPVLMLWANKRILYRYV